MATPTVRRLQLGHELRRWREQAGQSATAAAKVLGCNVAKISRLEHGQAGITVGDLTLLLQSYGAHTAEVDRLVALSRNNRERLRWTGHREGYPEWFRTYVDFERDAEDVRWNELEVVPGLLQTEPYVRGLLATSRGVSAVEDAEAVVGARLERQEVLRRDDPPMLSFILSESCVRRMVGDRTVMAEQVDHIVAVSRLRHVQIQLRPFDAPLAPGFSYRFTLMRIPVPGLAPSLEFVYCEDFDGARYLDDKEAVRAYGNLWGRMQAAALGPVESRSMLGAIAEDFRK